MSIEICIYSSQGEKSIVGRKIRAKGKYLVLLPFSVSRLSFLVSVHPEQQGEQV